MHKVLFGGVSVVPGEAPKTCLTLTLDLDLP